jgi:glycosyltransferase involved in cell wall biosynthesis
MLMVSHSGDFNGGGEIGFRDTMRGLRAKQPGLDLIAVYPSTGGMATDATSRNVRSVIANLPWWAYFQGRYSIKYAFRSIRHVLAILQALTVLVRLRPTIVLTNTMVIPSYAVASKLLGIQHFWMVREFGRDDLGLRFLLGYRRTIRMIGLLSETVICNSYAVEKAIRAVDPAMNTCVLYPVIDVPPGAPAKRHLADPLRAVLIGTFAQSKGQHIAIGAVAAARKVGVEIELTLVGAGDQEPLRLLAGRLGVEDLLSIHGPTEEVGRYWAAAHVGLMCSRSEAFGRVTVEAMNAGLPVCGTDAGGTSEIISPGVNGLLSPAQDAQALSCNLVSLALDEALRMRLAVGAVETARRFQRRRFDDELAAVLGLS